MCTADFTPDLKDSIAIQTIARGAGITLAQARAVLGAVVSLPREQADRIIERARKDVIRALSAQARRRG